MGGFFKSLRCFASARASRSIFTGLLLLLTAVVGITGQSNPLSPIRSALNNGHFEEVVRVTPGTISKARKTGAHGIASYAGVIQAHSLMRLEKYVEAAKALDEASTDAERAKHPQSTAAVYLAKASLARSLRDFPSAMKFARSALAAAPADPQVRLEYHLAIGRIMYSSGYDIAAIIWLERAERLSANLPMSWAYLDVLGHLSFAWTSKFNYAKGIEYGEKLVATSEKTEFKYRHRLARYEFAGLLDAVGLDQRAKRLRETGLSLALAAKDDYQSCLFLSTQMLDSLYKGDSEATEKQLLILDRVDRNKRFRFESILGKAVIAGLKGETQRSNNHFKELVSLKAHSDLLVPHWKAILAERRKDWPGLIEQMEVVRRIAEEGNFRDELPGVYFNLAKGYWGSGKKELAVEYARRSVAIVENDRPVGDAPLSLSILETYHSVYRLLAQIEESRNDPTPALELSDYSKARVLRDRIEHSALRRKRDLDVEVRKRADDLSTRLIEGNDVREELASLERSVTLSSPRGGVETKPDRGLIENISAPAGTSIASYFFTREGELRAFVVEHGKSLRVVKLSLSEKEADALAETVRTKIRDKVFFKSDGKEIYDKLLAPLSLSADHIVIVPDKALWKIPFHALSPDGESYLIEQRTVSYSPSVSMLLNELRKPAPIRESIQVFANDSFQDRYLGYVNREATKVAQIFSSSPVIGATRGQFLSVAPKSDILHFSMHAQADTDEPLNSFMAFKPQGRDSGRITVEDLLSVRLKKQSLAFLASCETNNVLNGEGLVSIAWSLLGSGSSSVISAQWEASDRSTELFTEEFYKRYREGKSTARALQAASVAMIRNKSTASHEPYFWAAFSLVGDYR